MRILQINLLSRIAQRQTQYAVWRHAAIRLGFMGVSIVMVAGVALLPSYFLLALQESEIQRQQVLEESSPLRKRAEDVAEAVASSNARVRILKKALAAEKSASQIAEAVFDEVPAGVRLKHVEFQRNSRRFSIAGSAAARSDILEFEKRLKALALAESVVSPLENIIRGADVSFTMQLIVKP